ncbi:MAG: hypothetical protein HY238_10995 [Acidobacteria bacterium]|nr:hypothetical protein [Acidobacteriota bacterium]
MRKILATLVIPVATLAFVLSGVPAYAATECSDSPSTKLLSDGSTLTFTSCYCAVNPAGETGLVYSLSGTTGLAATVPVTGASLRSSAQATPAPKGSPTVSCTNCPNRDPSVDVGAFGTNKTIHIDLALSGGAVKIGVQATKNPCD